MRAERILIATGGYLKKVVRVEKLVFTDTDEELEDFDSFESYVQESVEESAAELEQGFCQVLVIDPDQASVLIGILQQEIQSPC